MNIQSLFKNALSGKISDNSLKIKDSCILNLLLALIFSLSLVISLKLFGKNISDTLSLLFPDAFAFSGFLGLNSYISSIINKLIFSIFLISMLSQLSILFILPGIMYLISKYIFKTNVNYEICLSHSSSTNILPIIISSIGVIFLFLFPMLGYTILAVNSLLIMVLLYESFSTLIIDRKAKLMISTLISYLLSSLISGYLSYIVLASMIESKLNSIF